MATPAWFTQFVSAFSDVGKTGPLRRVSVILARYLRRFFVTQWLFITAILLTLLFVNQVANVLRSVSAGQATLLAMLHVLIYEVPTFLGYMLPLGWYLSVVIVISRFYDSGEMLAMFACGMSRLRLARILMSLSMVVAIVVAAITLYVGPTLQAARAQLLTHVLGHVAIDRMIPKRFVPFPDDTWVYADTVSQADEALGGVFIAHRQADNTWDVMAADDVRHDVLPHQSAAFFIFHRGNRYQVQPGSHAVRRVAFQQYATQLTTTAVHHTDWPLSAASSTLWEQAHHDQTLRRPAMAALHWRVAMPITVVLLTLIALPLSVSRLRSGQVARFLPAMLIYVAYAAALFIGRDALVQGRIPLGVGLWWVHGIVLILAVILNLRQWGWRHVFAGSRMRGAGHVDT